MIEIKLRNSNAYIKAQCVLCLRVFEREGLDALLYEDNEMIGYVCEECMKWGSTNFPSMLRIRAQWFRDRARELEVMAHEGVVSPSDGEYELLKKEREKEDQELLSEYFSSGLKE